MCRRQKAFATVALVLAMILPASLAAQSSQRALRRTLKDVPLGSEWIDGDLDLAVQQAGATGRPLLVAFRCVPCEACRVFDAQVVRRVDAQLAALLDGFVCVRIVQCWDMNLQAFQFDFDLSWAVVFMHPDKTVYGRYGTRSSRADAEKDISIEGFKQAMSGALELHDAYPQNRTSLQGKQVRPPRWLKPQDIPALRRRFSRPATGRRDCIHCHDVQGALVQSFRHAGRPIPEQLLWPYPMPDQLGLAMDAGQRATVASVGDGSPAQDAGFQNEDVIVTLGAQPILSTADIQWVLHHAADEDHLVANVQRGTESLRLTLRLPRGWRATGDLSWRASTQHVLRIDMLGLMKMAPMPIQDRLRLGLKKDEMAFPVSIPPDWLRTGNMAARRLLRHGDVIVGVDGRTDAMTESQLLVYLAREKRPGQSVEITVLRNSQRRNVQLTLK